MWSCEGLAFGIWNPTRKKCRALFTVRVLDNLRGSNAKSHAVTMKFFLLCLQLKHISSSRRGSSSSFEVARYTDLRWLTLYCGSALGLGDVL